MAPRIHTLPAGPAPRPLYALLWTLLLGATGFVMGFAALQRITVGMDLQAGDVLRASLAPALLCGAVASGASLFRSPRRVALAAFLFSLPAAIACTPLTLLFARLEDSFFHHYVQLLLAATVLGAIVALPLGVLFGLVHAALLGTLEALRGRRALTGLSSTLLFGGAGWFVVGLGVVGLTPASAVHRELGQQLGALLAAAGALLALLSLARIGWILLQLAWARRGRHRSWVVEAPRERDASLAPLLAFGPADAVLRCRLRTADGPFRSGDATVAVARVSRR
jgi:hypothetical protein